MEKQEKLAALQKRLAEKQAVLEPPAAPPPNPLEEKFAELQRRLAEKEAALQPPAPPDPIAEKQAQLEALQRQLAEKEAALRPPPSNAPSMPSVLEPPASMSSAVPDPPTDGGGVSLPPLPELPSLPSLESMPSLP